MKTCWSFHPKVIRVWVLPLILCGLLVQLQSGSNRNVGNDRLLGATPPDLPPGVSHEEFFDSLPKKIYSFGGRPLTDLELRGGIQSLATRFYLDLLAENGSVSMQEIERGGLKHSVLVIHDGGHLEHRVLLIRHGFGKGEFKSCLSSYLIWEMLRYDVEGKEAVSEYLDVARTRDPMIPRALIPDDWVASTLWEAVQEYTFQYDIDSKDDMRRWWEENADLQRDTWAREKVDAILQKGQEPSEEERLMLFKITKHLAISSPDGMKEFRSWWQRNRLRSQTTWVQELIERSIADLASEDQTDRERARWQFGLILGAHNVLDILLDTEILLDLPDDAVADRQTMRKVQKTYRDWWSRNRHSYRVGWYTWAAEAAWVERNQFPETE